MKKLTLGDVCKKESSNIAQKDIMECEGEYPIYGAGGFIKNVNEYRSNMDIGIVSSSNEAFGRVTIEGMLSGLAIVGANAAGTLELIQNKKNGMLYQKGNEKELAEILELLYNNRDYMKKIAKTGFQEALETYTTHRAAEKIASILQEI